MPHLSPRVEFKGVVLFAAHLQLTFFTGKAPSVNPASMGRAR